MQGHPTSRSDAAQFFAFLLDRFVRLGIAKSDVLDRVDAQWREARLRKEIFEFRRGSLFQKRPEFRRPDFEVVEARAFGCLQIGGEVSPHGRSAVKCKFQVLGRRIAQARLPGLTWRSH